MLRNNIQISINWIADKDEAKITASFTQDNGKKVKNQLLSRHPITINPYASKEEVLEKAKTAIKLQFNR